MLVKKSMHYNAIRIVGSNTTNPFIAVILDEMFPLKLISIMVTLSGLSTDQYNAEELGDNADIFCQIFVQAHHMRLLAKQDIIGQVLYDLGNDHQAASQRLVREVDVNCFRCNYRRRYEPRQRVIEWNSVDRGPNLTLEKGSHPQPSILGSCASATASR